MSQLIEIMPLTDKDRAHVAMAQQFEGICRFGEARMCVVRRHATALGDEQHQGRSQ